MRALALGLALLLSSCGHLLDQKTPAERVLIACTAWGATFEKVAQRRLLNLATDEEIEAINIARPVVNPICLRDPSEATATTADDIEAVLLAIILASERE